jgi:hypothetical protein
MAKAQPQPLPSRYRPYLAQSKTETAIRYGSQESALHQIFDQTTRDYYRQATAQRDAGMSVLGALKGADKGLRQVYAQSGLGPHLLSQIAGSPTGQRLAGELASNRVDVKNQLLGAQAGQQYIQQHLGDQYREDVGNINAQGSALAREKGLYQSDLLDQLITADKAARQQARLAAAKQRHDDALARQQIVSAQTNALIGQGLLPDPSGSLVPLPGGKADPNAPQFKDKPVKPKAIKPTGADRSIQKDFRKASSWIKQLDESNKHEYPNAAKRREVVQEILTKGDQVSGIPSVSSVGLDAALDMYYNRELSPATVEAIRSAGARPRFLPNTRTGKQRKNQQRKIKRPANAPDTNGQSRPT